MRLRHRIPAIFSLSMLDVLCCALGSVILLMLLNYWQARRQATDLTQAKKDVGATAKRLEESKQTLVATENARRRLQVSLDEVTAKLRTVEATADSVGKRLALTQQEVAQRQNELAARLKDMDAQKRTLQETQDRLTATTKQKNETAEIAALVPGLRDKIAISEKEAKALDADLKRTQKQAEDLRQQLADARKRGQSVEGELAAVKKRMGNTEVLLADLRKETEETGRLLQAAGEEKAKSAQSELARARRQLEEQKRETAKNPARPAAGDDRFAGVDLRGRRVVFLVDISGSMGSVDAQTPDATKWPEVTKNVVRLLKSLPQVEKYQVVIFSDEVQFLLGKPYEWLDFDKEKSADELARTLANVNPKGNTNLYAAFDAAFRLQTQGLDSIYLFSDGLPNVGPGLPANPPQDENAQSVILGKYLRDTIRGRWNRGTPKVQIHAVGFFYESPNLGAFLWALTRENGGSFVGMSKP